MVYKKRASYEQGRLSDGGGSVSFFANSRIFFEKAHIFLETPLSSYVF
jgi:hypothetical protein